MSILFWFGTIFGFVFYLYGVKRWIYQSDILLGGISLLVVFPMLIALSSTFPLYFFRAAPIIGVGMFIHHYGLRSLLQIKLLWYTTLTVLVVQGYYAFCGYFFGLRLWQ